MKIAKNPLSFIRKQARQTLRWMFSKIAWHYPRVYLRLIDWLKLRRSPYFGLVKKYKNEPGEIPHVQRHLDAQTKHASKNILFLVYWYELGGAESYSLYTMRAASRLGHCCFCISTVSSENQERASYEKHCVETLAYEQSDSGPDFTRFISNYIRKHSIDIVHIHHSVLMYEALPEVRKEFPELLIVDSTHIVEYEDGGFPYLSALYSDYVDRHNVISQNLIAVQRAIYQQLYGRELDIKKFYLTYLSSLTPATGPVDRHCEDHRKIVTFYGRLVLQKQPNIFVAAVEELMARHPELNVEAHIYGDGEMRAGLERIISRSRFKTQIRYLGRCDDKKEVFENTDILLLTSLNEGLSLTTYEALSFGRLVVSSDVGAQSELLCHECLIPLTSNFVAHAATKLFELLSDRDQYLGMLAQNTRNLEIIRTREISSTAINRLYTAER